MVRDYAPSQKFGFVDFSPICSPSVVKVVYRVRKDDLVRNEGELYRLKTEVAEAGFDHLMGFHYNFPPKNRFQCGASDQETYEGKLAGINETEARRIFHSVFS